MSLHNNTILDPGAFETEFADFDDLDDAADCAEHTPRAGDIKTCDELLASLREPLIALLMSQSAMLRLCETASKKPCAAVRCVAGPFA